LKAGLLAWFRSMPFVSLKQAGEESVKRTVLLKAGNFGSGTDTFKFLLFRLKYNKP
jgi:hypothetical protein